MTSIKFFLLLLFFTTNLVIRVRCRIEQVEKTYRINRLLVHPLIKKLVEEVERSGLEEEGLYRLTGSTHEMNMLANDCRFLNKDISQYDVNVITSYLKIILRNLTPSLIDETTFNRLSDALKMENLGELRNEMMNVVMKLEQDIRDTLAYLMEHLQKVAKLREINKMSPKNIGHVFGPILMNFRFDDEKAELALYSQKAKIIEELLNLPPGFWKMLTNYKSTETESNISNSEETEEGAWGGAASADSSALDERVHPRSLLWSQIYRVQLQPISKIVDPGRNHVLSQIQASRQKPMSPASRRIVLPKPGNDLMDEESEDLSKRLDREKENAHFNSNEDDIKSIDDEMD